jgi:hypothetical protein
MVVIAAGRARTMASATRHGFKREIAQKLDAFSLKEIGEATGLSLAACSRIRAGVKVPHARHWQALMQMLGGGERR